MSGVGAAELKANSVWDCTRKNIVCQSREVFISIAYPEFMRLCVEYNVQFGAAYYKKDVEGARGWGSWVWTT